MKHIWISNTAFAKITGVKKLCMTCGQPKDTADRVCPGKRT